MCDLQHYRTKVRVSPVVTARTSRGFCIFFLFAGDIDIKLETLRMPRYWVAFILPLAVTFSFQGLK